MVGLRFGDVPSRSLGTLRVTVVLRVLLSVKKVHRTPAKCRRVCFVSAVSYHRDTGTLKLNPKPATVTRKEQAPRAQADPGWQSRSPVNRSLAPSQLYGI